MSTLKMVLHVEKTLKTTIQKKLRKSQKFARKISVAEFRYSQTIFLRFTVTLFHSNLDEKITSSEQKVTSNEQKVTSNEQKVKSNEHKITNKEQKVTSKKFSLQESKVFLLYLLLILTVNIFLSLYFLVQEYICFFVFIQRVF